MTDTQWFWKGKWLEYCSCDWGCPCESNSPPSRGHCDGVVAMHIDEGHYGDIKLDGITVNERVLEHYMETTVGIVTALNPVIGYEKATELANEAYSSGKGILEIIREKKVLTEEQIADLLDPVKLTNLDPTKYPKPAPSKVK